MGRVWVRTVSAFGWRSQGSCMGRGGRWGLGRSGCRGGHLEGRSGAGIELWSGGGSGRNPDGFWRSDVLWNWGSVGWCWRDRFRRRFGSRGTPLSLGIALGGGMAKLVDPTVAGTTFLLGGSAFAWTAALSRTAARTYPRTYPCTSPDSLGSFRTTASTSPDSLGAFGGCLSGGTAGRRRFADPFFAEEFEALPRDFQTALLEFGPLRGRSRRW
jgi:hypothetical protein